MLVHDSLIWRLRGYVLKVRRPEFDFSDTQARWAPNGEFAQQMNAASAWIPHLERFLNRVMAKAGSKLKEQRGEAAERLHGDIRIFIRQEANHYAVHDAFNRILSRNGYDISEMERHFKSEFERLLETKSFPFLLAYCEGFETLGPPSALIWLDEEIGEFLEGADQEVVNFWKWHLLEEYEHRTVCHDVFHVLHGGYWMRLYGLIYQLWHLGGFTGMVRDYLIEKDRAEMTAAQRKHSRRTARKIRWKMTVLYFPKLIKVLSPFYTPRNSKEPRMYRNHMARVEGSLK